MTRGRPELGKDRLTATIWNIEPVGAFQTACPKANVRVARARGPGLIRRLAGRDALLRVRRGTSGTRSRATAWDSSCAPFGFGAQSLLPVEILIIRVERATRKNSQPAPARRVAMKMGWRLRCSSVRIDSDRLPPRALPTSDFDRNNIPVISGAGH
jgi:hypothetical protein